jgi:signal transduction histidine kinase
MEGMIKHIKHMPLWQATILAFLFLILMAAAGTAYHIQRLNKTFLADARDHARFAAAIIRLNTSHAVKAERLVADILTSFLDNTAAFITYLQAVEPFNREELTAFADQWGLAGISLTPATGGPTVSGPPDWPAQLRQSTATIAPGLTFLPAQHLAVYRPPRAAGAADILLAIDSRRIDDLRNEIGLTRTLEKIGELQGVEYARLETAPASTGKTGFPATTTSTATADVVLSPDAAAPECTATAAAIASRFPDGQPAAVSTPPSAGGQPSAIPSRPIMVLTRDNGPVVEVAVDTAGGRLVLGMDAAPLMRNRQRMWQYVLLFDGILSLVGAGLAWALYRYQRAAIARLRQYEQRLARQREEAALGRAAAAIAHEIRNPLNAIGMGLQHLSFRERRAGGTELPLLDGLREEIQRANRIVTGMLDFARPLEPRFAPLSLAAIVNRQVETRRPEMAARRIDLEIRLATDPEVKSKVEPKVEPKVKIETGMATGKTSPRGINPETAPQIFGDKNLLDQVIANLLQNAIEAQPDGGFIDIVIAGPDAGGMVRLCIANGGSLPPADKLAAIFAPYVTTKTRGTGLGLPVCRRIITAHGGTISARIDTGGKFVIEINLPTTAPEPQDGTSGSESLSALGL